MIATPSSSETGRDKFNYRPSPSPDQVINPAIIYTVSYASQSLVNKDLTSKIASVFNCRFNIKKSGHRKFFPAQAQNTTAAASVKHHDSQNQKFIDKCIQRLAHSRLFAIDHVKGYLCSLNRRGCRANTLRGNFTAIFLFLFFLKQLGRTCLDTVVRDDLASFIEHEQDRGLKLCMNRPV